MTAQSVLAAWFPPAVSPFNRSDLVWRPVPVNTVALDEDNLLVPFDNGTHHVL